MQLALQPVQVGVAGGSEGRLVMAEGCLVAVLVRLTEEDHGELAGGWFLETGYGPLDGPMHPTFADLDAAQNWIVGRLNSNPDPR